MHVMDMKNTTRLKTLPWPSGVFPEYYKSFIIVREEQETQNYIMYQLAS